MKRRVLYVVIVACQGLIAASGVANATTVGLDTAPLGNRANGLVRHVVWDSFTQNQVGATTSYTFSGNADAGSTLTNLSLSQNQAHTLGGQGAGILAPVGGPTGDAYYASTNPQSWTLNATAGVDVSAISFQIKTANVSEAVVNQLFVPTLVGVGTGTFYGSAQLVEPPLFGSFTNWMIEYRWSGLNIPAGTPLAITFSNPGGSSGALTRKPVDLVSLDVTAVPEPGSIVMLGIGATALVAVRRRFKRA